jgi:hypothetical protein
VSHRCRCCGSRLKQRPQNRRQGYCSGEACQKERRRQWRRAKLKADSDYRRNQYDSHQRWLEKHPEYWRDYRERHPEYVERNRELQKARDRIKAELGEVSRTGAVLAKSDACPDRSDEISVVYELLPVRSGDLAKSDASRRIFRLIPIRYSDFLADVPSCKEITGGTLAGAFDRPGTCRPRSP